MQSLRTPEVGREREIERGSEREREGEIEREKGRQREGEQEGEGEGERVTIAGSWLEQRVCPPLLSLLARIIGRTKPISGEQ